MLKDRGRWFGHVHRRATNEPLRKSELIQVEGMKKGRGRSKIALVEVIKKDMSIWKVREIMTLDRIGWRKRIHVAASNLIRRGSIADPKYWD